MSDLTVSRLSSPSGIIEVPAGNQLFAPGHPIQTVTTEFSTDWTTTSASWVDTGLSISITPKRANSKILLRGSLPYFIANSATTTAGGGFRLLDEANNLLLDTQGDSSGPVGVWVNTGLAGYKDMFSNFPILLLTAPGVTTQKTYRVQAFVRSGLIRLNYKPSGGPWGCKAVMTATEIAA